MLNEYDFSKAEKINMNTTDKVQVGDSTAGTSTSTTASQWQTYNHYNAERGWECPRCGRINAPWKSQCDCSGNNWIITSDWTYKPDWWKEVTCNPDTFRIHPESGPIWKAPSSTCGTDSATVSKSDPNSVHTYVTGTNNIVCGSDYWDNEKKEWTNIPKGYSNSVTSEDSPWNKYSTLTSQLDKLKYEIEELKETK